MEENIGSLAHAIKSNEVTDFTVLAATGDFIHALKNPDKVASLELATNVLTKLTSVFNPEHTIICPGNHDIDRTTVPPTQAFNTWRTGISQRIESLNHHRTISATGGIGFFEPAQNSKYAFFEIDMLVNTRSVSIDGENFWIPGFATDDDVSFFTEKIKSSTAEWFIIACHYPIFAFDLLAANADETQRNGKTKYLPQWVISHLATGWAGIIEVAKNDPTNSCS